SDERILIDEPRVHRIRFFIRAEVPGRVVAGDQETEGIAAALPGQLYGGIRIDDRPRMHRLQWRLQDFDAFEKEWPLLFKENREALIGGDDSFVRLDLREVRVQGHIERHRRRNAKLHGQARIEMERFIDETSRIQTS